MLRTEDLGELFLMELEGDRWSPGLEKRLRKLHPGGIIFAPQNLRAPDSTTELLTKIARALDFRPILALEEEGGAVDPLGKIFHGLPSPQTVSQRGPEAALKLGELAGAGLKLLGFNTNFAPRLDLLNPMDKTSLHSQSFGSEHQVVTRCGAAFVRGLKPHGILACGKYFPGHGDARPDRDTGLCLSSKPMARMWREDLEPYLKLLRQLTLVMVSHRAYKAYDFDVALPASLSANVLEGLLRVKLDYRGVALVEPFVTSGTKARTIPPLASGETQEGGSLNPEAGVKSIAAGADMVVVRGGEKAFERAAENLSKALEAGTIAEQRVGDALKRIRRARKNIPPPTGKFSRNAFERLCREFERFSQEF
ncbi:MAG TPA: glycoside hydrolase family 3 N-terminal domain-containing protein [Terriglobia bacterium]|nr:glycoside hydrolase family 3 N-terminal domain-containing protein [Terriglobia bacterium]